MTLVAAATAHDLVGGTVLFNVVVTLAAAVVLGMLMQHLRQSVMVGYLLAGVLLGPGALGIVRDTEALSFMGEVGIALLLFTIGLELPWHRLQRVGGHFLSAGLVQAALTTIVTAAALVALADMRWQPAVAIGMAVSLSSTAVVIRLLADRAETDSVHGLASLGMLLAQDLAVVAFLLVVPELGDGSDSVMALPLALGLALAKLALLVAGAYVLELVLMRRLFRHAVLGSQRELLALSSLVVSLGAVGASAALGMSPALGGFVAGMLMADAPYSDQVRAEISSIRMGLVAVFFAWVGMLADLDWMLAHAPQILLLVAAVFLGKAVITALVLRAFGAAGFVAVLTGIALAQLGEFSFAIATAAIGADLLTQAQFQLLVSVSLVTLLLTPTAMHLASRAVHRPRDEGRLRPRGGDAPLRGHVIVVGYGPSGQAVVDAMVMNGHSVTLVELNPRREVDVPHGVAIVQGDASRTEILDRAGLADARLVVVTIPEPAALRRMLRQIRQAAPHLPVIARGRYHIYLDQLTEAGATTVVDEERVTGHELARLALDAID